MHTCPYPSSPVACACSAALVLAVPSVGRTGGLPVLHTIMFRALCLATVLLIVTGHDHGHSHENPYTSSKGAEFRKKWDAADIIRDVEHIKEDLSTLIHLQKTGEMTKEEITFYYFRMHDFDDNELLDGIEMLAAMQHSLEHVQAVENVGLTEQPLERVIEIVDSAMMLDTNLDGYISYPELRVTNTVS